MAFVFAGDSKSAPCYHVFLEMESVDKHTTLTENQKRMVRGIIIESLASFSLLLVLFVVAFRS